MYHSSNIWQKWTIIQKKSKYREKENAQKKYWLKIWQKVPEVIQACILMNLHMNGFTLLWMCLCCLRPEDVAKVLPHSGQVWARAPTCCERMWRCRLLGSVNTCGKQRNINRIISTAKHVLNMWKAFYGDTVQYTGGWGLYKEYFWMEYKHALAKWIPCHFKSSCQNVNAVDNNIIIANTTGTISTDGTLDHFFTWPLYVN